MSNLIQFDKRAIHRIVSDPSVLDIANDADADIQDAIALCHNVHFMALGTGNEELVRLIARLGNRITHARSLIHRGLDLYAGSVVVEPYEAVRYAALEAVA